MIEKQIMLYHKQSKPIIKTIQMKSRAMYQSLAGPRTIFLVWNPVVNRNLAASWILIIVISSASGNRWSCPLKEKYKRILFSNFLSNKIWASVMVCYGSSRLLAQNSEKKNGDSLHKLWIIIQQKDENCRKSCKTDFDIYSEPTCKTILYQ